MQVHVLPASGGRVANVQQGFPSLAPRQPLRSDVRGRTNLSSARFHICFPDVVRTTPEISTIRSRNVF